MRSDDHFRRVCFDTNVLLGGRNLWVFNASIDNYHQPAITVNLNTKQTKSTQHSVINTLHHKTLLTTSWTALQLATVNKKRQRWKQNQNKQLNANTKVWFHSAIKRHIQYNILYNELSLQTTANKYTLSPGKDVHSHMPILHPHAVRFHEWRISSTTFMSAHLYGNVYIPVGVACMLANSSDFELSEEQS